MFNVRTWHRLGLSGWLALVLGVLMLILVPGDAPEALGWLVITLLAWGVLVASCGGVMGVLLALGKLRLGCPLCDESSEVLGGGREGMHLDCPKCGELTVKIGGLFGMKILDSATEAGDEAKLHEREAAESVLPGGIWSIPRTHTAAFIAVLTPVVATIVAASVLHRFSFFYLLIPGFWCYGVGSFLIHAVVSGRMSDSGGTAERRNAPVRFWGNIGIWALFYLLAAAFPIGFALQERDREAEAAAEKEPAIEAEAAPASGEAL